MNFRMRCGLALAAVVCSTSPLVPLISAEASTAPIKGIAVLVDGQGAYTDASALVQARTVFNYVKSLKATGVQLNFPISTPSATSNTFTTTSQAPSAARLGSMIALARSLKLNVQVRPLIDESTLAPTYFRGDLNPSNVATWFTNYLGVLRPYLAVAKSSGAQEFALGSELTSMYQNPYSPAANPLAPRNTKLWASLITSVKKIYGGTLIIVHNFNALTPVANTKFGFDAYGPVTSLGPDASVSELTSAIKNNWTQGPSQAKYYTSIQSPYSSDYVEEVGISAVKGMYATPWSTKFTNPTIDRTIQSNWFTANCNAFFSLKMAGIYFWMISFPGYSANRDTSHDAPNWFNTSVEGAVKSCFARSK